MLSKIISAVYAGVEGKLITIETDVTQGLPAINIVGLASTTIMEAKERIRAAIVNSGYEFPRGRITINLRPANLRKNSTCLDLSIAIGILSSNLNVDMSKACNYGIVGELSLDGSVMGVDGILPIVQEMLDGGVKKVIVPYANYGEAALIAETNVIPVASLTQCVEVINGTLDVMSIAYSGTDVLRDGIEFIEGNEKIDYSDIKGQETAKRAIVVAVTGRHGILMVGSPGCGKTMIARRIPTIMPEMSRSEIIETAIIYSVTGQNNRAGYISTERPFRCPHSTIGRAGLLGGGLYPVPGEITMAHNGVLFLDEVCEFDRENIEALRVPLEEHYITHFRKGIRYRFPCNFQLVMAANPCKCGYYGSSDRICKCSPAQLDMYNRKLSGPIVDRIDMRISMENVTSNQIVCNDINPTCSEDMKHEVERGLAFARKMGRTVSNGSMTDADIQIHCALDAETELFMKNAYEKLKLSPRSYKRVLKVSRTIADLDESECIKSEHIAEAISYRMLEAVNEN